MRKYKIELDDFDLGQVLDGLEMRAAAWENTAKYHRTGESGVIVEEGRDAEEAEKISRHYRSIIVKIRKQREEQS
jgi:hypothetical protein